MKIVTIVGARPQFIKCAPVSRELRKEHKEILVHTGQHYDPEMSDIFFKELQIPRPNFNLDVGSGPHGKQTSQILELIEKVLIKEKPDLVMVYGDTNSTLAGALAAIKLHIPVAHVEAGLRSFDRAMPEEINRIVADHVSELLFCPTENAVNLLAKEGIIRGVYLVGDVMADVLAFNRELAQENSRIIEQLSLTARGYCVATIHRPSNTDNKEALSAIISAFEKADVPIVFPVHPRTRKCLVNFGLIRKLPENIHLIDPLGYLDMIHLMGNAKKILTDSGGIQKEAYMLGVPCITLRENTEWVETVDAGGNVLVGVNNKKIISAIQAPPPKLPQQDLYPQGASLKILDVLREWNASSGNRSTHEI